jgi:hypothetical protein
VKKLCFVEFLIRLFCGPSSVLIKFWVWFFSGLSFCVFVLEDNEVELFALSCSSSSLDLCG